MKGMEAELCVLQGRQINDTVIVEVTGRSQDLNLKSAGDGRPVAGAHLSAGADCATVAMWTLVCMFTDVDL